MRSTGISGRRGDSHHHQEFPARYRRKVSTEPHRGCDAAGPRPHRRPALAILAVLAALGCLALGWWQWKVFDSTAGTGQNLGYALQWPLFAAFVIYAYRKFIRYESEPPQFNKPEAVTEIPAGLLPERPRPQSSEPEDPVMHEYNAYLAELAKADNDRDRTNR